MLSVRTMKGLVTIRPYRDQDREDCRSLWHELADRHREIYGDPTIGGEHPEEYFDKHLAKVGSGNIWVAQKGLGVVGFVGLIIEGTEAEMEPLVVRKSSRHEGIGTRLVQAVISEARKRGVRFLNVKPVARNEEAIKFFYRQGFAILGHVDMFMDFSGRRWKSGIDIHGCRFEF